jgi:hypothetical protein
MCLLHHFAKDEHLSFDQQYAELAWGLRLICEFEWWSRVWVVQETLLSRSAYLVLGKAKLSWDTTFQAASKMVKHITTCCRGENTSGHKRMYQKLINECIGVSAEVILSFQRVPRGTSNELLANLWTFRNRLATLDHDKVYGLLGMLTSGDLRIQPDYNVSFPNLCRSVTLEDIRMSGNLHSFLGTRNEIVYSACSSWATDWSRPDYWAEDRARILAELYKQVYCASGMHKPRVKIYHSVYLGTKETLRNKYLSVAGQVIDNVIHVIGCSYLSDLEDEDEDEDGNVMESLLETLQVLEDISDNTAYIAGGSIFNAFWRTLVGDCILEHQNSYNPFGESQSQQDGSYEPSLRRAKAADFVAFLLWWTSQRYVNGLFGCIQILETEVTSLQNSLSKPASIPRSRRSQPFDNVPAVRNVRASFRRATTGRCMFVTSKGYLGLGPQSMNQRDSVAILLGGSTPFILNRRSYMGEESIMPAMQMEKFPWELHGDCYVHGCMDGELVPFEDTENWPELVLV